MTTVYGIIMIFIIIACILLVLVVLSQNPKGGGLSSTFGGSGTQMFGVQKTNDFMDKATWSLGGIIVVLSIFAAVLIAKPSVYNSKDQQVPQSSHSQQPVNPANNGK
ncbi:preprotein translocase subunit SecG [Apibacter adventoris]|uniref:Protein-export membrane protein SecG n=1 Tax=Apibacter adventoris TaxID=1679466 RepID=A0A2S8AE16_9FLAO|nr:preprotein translocase subunit SecG [Apibacter adventoris]PQL93181.1 preprotein translocase subunit SecG [Apibacter adventoris]PQL95886.1 preprotein translocase subunit SecG [Apibacter adventoris]